MPRFNFIGGTHQSYSDQADGQRTINLFPERIESGMGKTDIALYGTPGLRFFAELPSGLVRALHTEPFQFPSVDRVFAVAGTKFYEVFSSGTVSELGTVANDNFPAFIASNGVQLFIASSRSGYVFNLTTGLFTGPIYFDDASGPITPVSAVFLDGWFVSNFGGQSIYFSSLYDGLAWNALDFFSAEGNPDNCVRLLADHRELWAFGDSSIQVYSSTGDTDTPFAPIPGAFMEQGIWAPNSAVKLDNSVFWLGGDERGKNIVWRATGWTAQRISTHAIENQLRQMSSTVEARGWCYTDFGHAFYCLTIPSGNYGQTLIYDASTNLWHERGCWNQRLAAFDAHHAWNHVWGFNKHLVGDRGGTCCVTTEETCPADDGALLTGDWSNNSRVGPFFNQRLTNNFDGKAWGVFKDPNNALRLIVQYRSPTTGAWGTVDDVGFSALSNAILSHDPHQDQYTDSTVLHVLTQEQSSGRVAYHRFNKVSNTWELFNSEVTATETILSGGVSCTVASNGDIIAFYESSKENVGAADRYRCQCKISTDGGLTWGTAIDIGRRGEAQSSGLARAVADADNRIHLFFNVSPGFFVPSTADLEVRTLNSARTLSSIVTWAFTGALGPTPQFYMGDPATFTQGSSSYLAIPIKRAGSAEVAIFVAADTLSAIPASDLFLPGDPLVEESSLGAKYAMFTLRAINGSLAAAFLGLVGLGGTWMTVKTGGYANWSPGTAYDNQSGPRLTLGETGRDFGANFFSCHEQLYVATFLKLADGQVMFNMTSLANLPDASTYTLTDWMARFA